MTSGKTASSSPRAWILAAGADAVAGYQDVCWLAGLVPVVAIGPVEEGQVELGDVVVMDAGQEMVPSELAGLPRVVVRRSSGRVQTPPDITLPGAEAQLLRLLADMSAGAQQRRARQRVLLVGAWHGGGGATATALALAAASGAVLADAAGNRGGWVPRDKALCWSDLSAGDLPAGHQIVAALPRQSGVPTVSPDAGPPVGPSDRLVTAFLSAIPRSAVVDCGTDLHGLNILAAILEDGGTQVAIVLVGRGSGERVTSLARHCAVAPLRGLVTYLPRGRRDRMFLSVAKRYELRWRRLPGHGIARRWVRLEADLWDR